MSPLKASPQPESPEPSEPPGPEGVPAPHETIDRHVLLIGMPGAGKTSVGRRLAKDLGRPFADSDEQVELHVGRSIPRMFAEDGEEAFRRWEAEVFAQLLNRTSPLVVSAGGGTVTREANRRVAKERSTVVWLQASPEFLAGRTDVTHRPLLTADPEGTYQRLASERREIYAALADLVVDVEPFHLRDADKPRKAIAAHIAELIRAGTVGAAR